MKFELQTPYTFEEIIIFAYNEIPYRTSDSFFEGKILFRELEVDNDSNFLRRDMIIYLDILIFENNENEEYYSDFVIEKNLDIICLGEIFIDIIDSYKDYKKELDIDLVLEALHYYLDNDDFMEIN